MLGCFAFKKQVVTLNALTAMSLLALGRYKTSVTSTIWAFMPCKLLCFQNTASWENVMSSRSTRVYLSSILFCTYCPWYKTFPAQFVCLFLRPIVTFRRDHWPSNHSKHHSNLISVLWQPPRNDVVSRFAQARATHIFFKKCISSFYCVRHCYSFYTRWLNWQSRSFE